MKKTKKQSKQFPLKNIKAKSDVVSARKWVKENDVMRDDKLTWETASPYESTVSVGHEWVTQCGRYRVKRAKQRYGGDARYPDAFYVEFRNSIKQAGGTISEWWDAVSSRVNTTQCKQFKTLQEAFEAAENKHCERTGREEVTSNANEIVILAKKQGGLHEIPYMVSARSFSSQTQILKAERTVDDNKKNVKASAVIAEPKVKVSRIGLGEKDKFGNRVGTRAAKINAVLSSEGKTVGQIEKESGATSIPSHLNTLVKMGVVVKDGKNYRLKV